MLGPVVKIDTRENLCPHNFKGQSSISGTQLRNVNLGVLSYCPILRPPSSGPGRTGRCLRTRAAAILPLPSRRRGGAWRGALWERRGRRPAGGQQGGTGGTAEADVAFCVAAAVAAGPAPSQR